MFIKQATLRNARSRGMIVERYSTKEASIQGRDTAFLSHSHFDRELAEGLRVYLKEMGWNVYIDWLDETMPEKISGETANRLKAKIKECQLFFFLATANSCLVSRWCPWEIGIADSQKGPDKVFIIPTKDDKGYEHGNEYLSIYRKITEERDQSLGRDLAAVMPPAGQGIWLKHFSGSKSN